MRARVCVCVSAQDPAAFRPQVVAKSNVTQSTCAHIPGRWGVLCVVTIYHACSRACLISWIRAAVWVRALHNGDMAVALINTGTEAHDITVQLSDVVCARCDQTTVMRTKRIIAGYDRSAPHVCYPVLRRKCLLPSNSAVVCSCPRKATVVDVWGGDSLGSEGPRAAVTTSDVYTASNVHSHETILLRMTPLAAANHLV